MRDPSLLFFMLCFNQRNLCGLPAGPWWELSQLLPLLGHPQGSHQPLPRRQQSCRRSARYSMPMGVGVLGQLMCIQPLDLLGDLLPEIFWQSQLRLRNTDI